MAERGSKEIKERLSESLELVRKFKELGISDQEPGFVQMRAQMNDWIRDGPAWTGRIEFPRYNRYAQIVLPDRAGCIASIAFNMYK
jgi:hypothetical protein